MRLFLGGKYRRKKKGKKKLPMEAPQSFWLTESQETPSFMIPFLAKARLHGKMLQNWEKIFVFPFFFPKGHAHMLPLAENQRERWPGMHLLQKEQNPDRTKVMNCIESLGSISIGNTDVVVHNKRPTTLLYPADKPNTKFSTAA